jgi:four helix bundle protein
MATITKFEDIDAWKKARVLSKEIFTISNETALNKDFRFRDQINSAVGSVMDNIAEGFERGGKLEFINFLAIAKGSAAEVRSQFYRIYDRHYINEEKFVELHKLVEEIGNMLGGWIKYLNQSELAGTKFKDRLGSKP